MIQGYWYTPLTCYTPLSHRFRHPTAEHNKPPQIWVFPSCILVVNLRTLLFISLFCMWVHYGNITMITISLSVLYVYMNCMVRYRVIYHLFFTVNSLSVNKLATSVVHLTDGWVGSMKVLTELSFKLVTNWNIHSKVFCRFCKYHDMVYAFLTFFSVWETSSLLAANTFWTWYFNSLIEKNSKCMS